MENIDLAYKSIGEFVVTFQWIENKYREIGWFILDPERRSWPPMELRKESNEKLIDRVTEMFCELVDKFELPGGDEKKTNFLELKKIFHGLRRFRNTLLHSAYIEMNAGGEVVGFLRSNPKIGVDPETGEMIHDQETFSQEVVHRKLGDIGKASIQLSQIYLQLTHWHPFDRFPLKA